MTALDSAVLARVFAITAVGVGLGLLLSMVFGLLKLAGKYKHVAKSEPKEKLLPALGMACVPLSKLIYAFIVATILSQRNLSADTLSMLATFAGGAFALVAVLQGALAAKLINTPTENNGFFGTDLFKFQMLGGMETLAIFALVVIIIFSVKVATGA